VITAAVLEPTGDGVSVKLAVVEPDVTVTEAGTAAEPLLLDSATLVLPVRATFRVTVQLAVAGAVTLDGLQVRFVGTGAGGSSVSENVFELLFNVAVITTVVLELTADGVSVKLAVVEPELTVTEAGTAAEPLLLDSATLVLLVGATFRVTVQVAVAGAVTLDGLQVRFVGTGAGGSSVSENVCELPFSVAVITAAVLEPTGDGVSVKLAVVEPDVTVTEAGTAAEPLLLDSGTPVLLVGATFRLTVQVAVAGAVTLGGLQVRLVGTGAGGWLMITVAPLAAMVTGMPVPSAADAPTSATGDEVSVVPAAI